MVEPRALDDAERAIYEWQLSVPGFGEAGQERLKGASVLVARVGGLGGVVAYELAAAGVGRLVLANAGSVKPSDLNRHLLLTHEGIGRPRLEVAVRKLKELNPRVEILAVPENPSAENAASLVGEADVVVDCAPHLAERLALNHEAVRQRKPMVECSMYALEAHITTLWPGETPCLACLHPEEPPPWEREFPVFGAVAGTVGCLAAMEAIKLLTGVGQALLGQLLTMDLRDMSFRSLHVQRDESCPVCE